MHNYRSLTNLLIVFALACFAALGCNFNAGRSNSSNAPNSTNSSNSSAVGKDSDSSSPNSSNSNSGAGSDSRATPNSSGGTSNSRNNGGGSENGDNNGGDVGSGGGGSNSGSGNPGGGGGSNSVQLNNYSSHTIMYFYMSPTSQSTWGPDRLGSSTIPPGRNFTVNNVPCDSYDVKIVYDSGLECPARNRQICASGTRTLNVDDHNYQVCQSQRR